MTGRYLDFISNVKIRGKLSLNIFICEVLFFSVGWTNNTTDGTKRQADISNFSISQPCPWADRCAIYITLKPWRRSPSVSKCHPSRLIGGSGSYTTDIHQNLACSSRWCICLDQHQRRGANSTRDVCFWKGLGRSWVNVVSHSLCCQSREGELPCPSPVWIEVHVDGSCLWMIQISRTWKLV